jgi:hypothetical protein
MQPKKSSLTTLSNEALCKLRDEIAAHRIADRVIVYSAR